MKKLGVVAYVVAWAVAAHGAGSTGYYAQIHVDGNFADWAGVPAFYDESETNDYAEGAFDCRYVKLANSAESLYVTWETREALAFGNAAWGYKWYLDTDRSATSGFRGAGAWMTHGYDYMIEGAWLYRYTGSGEDWAWQALGAGSFAVASNRIELAVPRDALGDALVVFGQFGTNAAAQDTIPYEDVAETYVMAAAPPPPGYFAHIVVDGDDNDWAGIAPLFSDAAGDYLTNDVGVDIAAYDVTNVFVANDDEHVFVRLALRGAVDASFYGLYLVYFDVDCSVTSGLTWGWWSIGADRRTFLTDWVHMVSPTGVVQAFMGTGPADDTWGWGGVVASTEVANVWCAAGGNTVEFGIPRVMLAATNDGTVVALLARLVQNDLGGDGDAAPMFNAPPAKFTVVVPEPWGLEVLGVLWAGWRARRRVLRGWV